MTALLFEVKNCTECGNCYSERFYTVDPWEHETNYYCKLFVGYNKYPKTDHDVDKLRAIRNKPGVIELFADRGITVDVPDWCPIKLK